MSRAGRSWLPGLLLSMCLTQPAFSEVGVSEKEILLGAPNAQSGQNAKGGKETNIGISALINSVNEQGGVNGRKIRLVSCDDKYEPQESIACFQKLSSDGVFGLIGIYGSACAAKYVSMCTSNKIPVAGFHAGTFFITDPPKRYVFEVRADYRDEMHDAVEHLWKDSGKRRFGIIYQNDAFGADCMEGVKQGLKKFDAQLVATASYTRNKTDVKDAVDQVRKGNPEVVFLGAVFTPCSEIIKLAHEMNWHPIWVLNSGTSVDLFIPEAGPLAEGTLFTEVVPPPSRTDLPLITRYLKAMKDWFPNENPGFVSLRGYMDALVWVEGLKRAGKELTREKWVDAVESIHHLDVGLGKGMELSYTPADHLGLDKVYVGVIKDGQPVSFDGWKALKSR